ncbi:PepSY domain-containing protein [Rhodoferax sp. BLA1]|uniref:PepSY-associated TM helix domain-containing protein n=1 Tax=Rhodoferax sp. BLA1 TaxID=2576062 RepID=UPI0015D1DC0B|nr:PepSY-associated TM helix domain-containing protein [Rhodoferax sp. BLA1]
MRATHTPETGAATGGLRQSMAWLHTWCGLWFSWLLFAVFLTGSLAVFEEPITHWMTPEHHAEEEAEEAARASLPATAPVASRAQRLAYAIDYMAKHHQSKDMWEIWPADAEGGGELKVYWFDDQHLYAQAKLDANTGATQLEPPPALPARGTLGGQHFVDFHYNLHGGTLGLWVVAFAAMVMLVALVSGVITHKRIFKDFFTFRPKKGQRSWLDAHNAVAVLSLPFQFMIAYTGIVFTATTYLPAGVLAHYGNDTGAHLRYTTELTAPGLQPRSGRPLPVPGLEPFAAQAEALIGQPVRAVVVDHPGDASMRISVYGWNDPEDLVRRMSDTTGMVAFAPDGKVLHMRIPGGSADGVASFTNQVMSNLHMAGLGGWPMKWLFFLCGLAGTAMMGTGAVLFTVKRRNKSLNEFGPRTASVYRGIEALNVAAIAGLALACMAYLWANRLLPLATYERAVMELQVFFGVWLMTLVHACARTPQRAWREQLWALSALCLLLPVLNGLTAGDHLIAEISRGDWESAGVELTSMAFGLLAGWGALLLRTDKAGQPRRTAHPSLGPAGERP